MKVVYFNGITEMGSTIQNARVIVSEDCTMRQLVNAIKDQGYVMFQLPTMKVYAHV